MVGENRGFNSFEQRIDKALESYASIYRQSLENGSASPKLSVSAFMKYGKISRAALYGRHKDLLTRVQLLFSVLKAEEEQKRLSGNRPTIISLQRELAKIKKQAKIDLADAHSAKMADLLQSFGPAFRDATQAMIERQQHLRIIGELRKQVANQIDIIRRLTAQLNS